MPTTVQIDGVGEVEFPDSMNQDQIVDAIKTKILGPKTPNTETKTAKPETKRGFLETLAAGMSPLGVAPTPDVTKGLGEEISKPIKELPKPTWQEFQSATGLSQNSAQNLTAFINNVTTPAVEFMESPAGLMTAGAGAVPAGGTIVGGLFTAQALKSAPETWRKVGELWEKAHAPGATPEDKMALKNAIAEAGVEGLVATAGAIPGARDASGKLTPKAVQLAKALREEVAKAELPEPKQPEPKVETVTPEKGQPNAQAIRSDQGQPQETGVQPETSKTDSGGNVQQAPSGTPDASPQGKVPLTPEEQAKLTSELDQELGQEPSSQPTPKTEATKPVTAPATAEPKTSAESPVTAASKVEDHVQDVAQTEGKRPAKEVKSELVQRLEKAINDAPNESDVQSSSYTKVTGERVTTPDKAETVTIDIPGDGTFTIRNTKEALTGILKRAKAIETSPTGKTPVKNRGIPKAITEETRAEIAAQQQTTVPKSEPSEGLGIIPQPPKMLREFAKQDVAPLIKRGVDAVKAAKDIIVETFSPTSKAKSSHVDTLMEGKGYKEQFTVQAAAALEDMAKVTAKLDPQEGVDFFDRMKTGQRQPNKELQDIADVLRKWDDKLFDEAKVYRPDLPYLQNHERVIWQVVPGSPEAKARLAGQGMTPSQIQSIMSKRPWQGSKGFLKKHVLNDMSEGIRLGGVPVTTDPIRMFLLHAEDTMKFVAANRAFERLKSQGAIEFVKRGEKAPEGYARIDDRIADVYFRVPQGMVEAGKWWADEDAARLINNYLSRDYVRGQGKFAPIGQSLMGLKNAYTAVELGLSPFHAVFETIETVGSEIGRAAARASSGNVVGAAKELAKAAGSPYGVAKEGGMGIRYAKDPAAFKAQYPEAYKYFTSKYPDADAMIKDLFTGGGTIKMWDDYRLKSGDGMRQAWANDNHIGAVIRAAPWLAQKIQTPLFDLYIPRLKVGMFLRDYAFELERNADKLASGKLTRDALARRTWAFVEDRFGEMNFDNLYWDRTFKSAMQLMFRSVTWKLGNIRGFGKAAVDTVKFGNDIAHGIKPTVTLPMGWALGLTATTATIGSLLSKAFSGKYPWEWATDDDSLAKDTVYPHISATDPSQRVSIPTYLRDLIGMRKGLIEYGRSSMTGMWGKILDDWQNKDFYGTEVRHPGDPIGQQAGDLVKHLFPVPFSISSAVKAKETGATPTQSALGFAGFTKAPWNISHTAAEIKAGELLHARMPQGSRTAEEFERSVQERRALESVKRKEMTVYDAVRSGLVTSQRAKQFASKTVQTPLVNAIHNLPAKDAVEVYEQGNDSEKAQIRGLVLMKIKRAGQSKHITAEEYKDLVERVRKP